MPRAVNLAIILPVYNPRNGWVSRLKESILLLNEALETSYDLVIVNDGSSMEIDEKIIHNLKNEFPFLKWVGYKENKGKGFAIRYGLENVDAKYYIYTDFDFPFGYKAVNETYQLLDKNDYSLIIGKRGKSYFKILPFKRKVMSLGLQMFNYFLTGFKVSDTQAGLKGLDNNGKDIFLKGTTDSFLFEIEFIKDILKAKLPYTNIEIVPKPDITMTNFGSTTIKKELSSLMKIIFK